MDTGGALVKQNVLYLERTVDVTTDHSCKPQCFGGGRYPLTSLLLIFYVLIALIYELNVEYQ